MAIGDSSAHNTELGKALSYLSTGFTITTYYLLITNIVLFKSLFALKSLLTLKLT